MKNVSKDSDRSRIPLKKTVDGNKTFLLKKGELFGIEMDMDGRKILLSGLKKTKEEVMQVITALKGPHLVGSRKTVKGLNFPADQTDYTLDENDVYL